VGGLRCDHGQPSVLKLEPPLDALDLLRQFVEGDLMAGIGFIAERDFTLDQAHRAFQAGHAMPQIAPIVGDLINTAGDVPQVLENQVVLGQALFLRVREALIDSACPVEQGSVAILKGSSA
jgi:hypothetical protein